MKKISAGLSFFIIASFILLPLQAALAAGFITLDRFSGPPGTIEVTGGGYASNEVVSLYLGGVFGTPTAAATTDASGNFTSPISIPFHTPQGNISIIAVSGATSERQTNSYYVVPFSPTIAVSGNTTPGGALSISGNGFAPNESVHFWLQGRDIGQVTTDANGSFANGAAIIPTISSGTYVLQAIGQSSNAAGSEYVYVNGFFPNIIPSTYYLIPSQTITFTGSGYAANETIHVLAGENASAMASFSADANGNFAGAGSVTIPFHFSGAQVFRLHGATSNASATVDIMVGGFNPAVTPSTFYLLPGEPLSFSVEAFAANETVKVYLADTSAELATFNTDASGGVANLGTFTIPFSWTNSSRTFRLVGQLSGATANTSVTIGQFNSLVSASTYHIAPGSPIFFTGTGFAPTETVFVTESESGSSAGEIATDASGSFADAGSFPIPYTWFESSRIFRFVGEDSGTVASVAITVAPFNVAVTPSTFYVMPGSSFTLSGTGFAPGELITISTDRGRVAATTDESGAFLDAGPIYAPVQGQALHVTAVGATSGAIASADISLGTLSPNVSPDHWYLPSGATITFSGNGFAPSESVTVSSASTTLATITTDASGIFANYMTTTGFGPDRISRYTFTGNDSGAVTEVILTLAALQPYIALDTYYVTPGSAVGVTGSGFAPGESVTVRVGTATTNGLADAMGNLATTTIGIPVATLGSTTMITATGETSGAIGASELTLAPFSVQVTPSAWYTPRETGVTFLGMGFYPGETITITLNGLTVGTAMVMNDGTFVSDPLAVPYGARGASFAFTGADSRATTSITLALAAYIPHVLPASWYAPLGSNMIFTGTNFAPGETVAILFNDAPAGTALANELGHVTTTAIHIPTTATHANFVFTGSESAMNTYLPITLGPLVPGLMLSSYYDYGGNELTVTGLGFGLFEQVDVTFDGAAFGTAMTDASGTFTLTHPLPHLAPGEKMIRATGQSSGGVSTVAITLAPRYIDLQLASYAGAPGEAVTFVGHGYAPGDTMTVETDRSIGSTVHTFMTDANGSFTDAGYILSEAAAPGPITFTIRGAQSFAEIDITYYVTGG